MLVKKCMPRWSFTLHPLLPTYIHKSLSISIITHWTWKFHTSLGVHQWPKTTESNICRKKIFLIHLIPYKNAARQNVLACDTLPNNYHFLSKGKAQLEKEASTLFVAKIAQTCCVKNFSNNLRLLNRLQKMFSRKWEYIFMQAEAQSKVDKKRDKQERKILDTQERAFWDVYRPPPGCVNTTDLDIKKVCKIQNTPNKSSDNLRWVSLS